MLKANFISSIKNKNPYTICVNKLFSTTSSIKDENIFTHLNERKLIANISNAELLNSSHEVDKLLKSQPRMYIGFDPTAESLHLGNLIGILTAIRFAAYGIEPVFLLGGATGQIGDPSGKNKERPLLMKEKINSNLEMIENSIRDVMGSIKSFGEVKTFFKVREEIANKLREGSNSNSKSNSSDEEEKLIERKIKKIKKAAIKENNSNNTRSTSNDLENFMKNMEIASKENLVFKSMVEDNLSDSMNYKIIDNNIFYKDLNIIDFLREVGINLRMGPLLSRETVKNRLSTKEGLSLTEFMYQTFQGFDYLKLYEKLNVRIQIGGSDQWGNMLAGYELIKKTKNSDVVNLTFPLMTTANGQKFGKSEGNAVFINPALTPVNTVFQYFYNLADADLSKMFNAFTFISTKEIDEIIAHHSKLPEKRSAQKILGEKVVGMLFSEDEAVKCRNNCEAHYVNFGDICKKTSTGDTIQEIDNLLKDCQITEIPEESLDKLTISHFCVTQKILPTKAQCKRLIQSGSLSVNNSKINDDVVLNKEMFLGGKYMVLKTGKKHTHIFQIKKNEKNEQVVIESIKMEQKTTTVNRILS